MIQKRSHSSLFVIEGYRTTENVMDGMKDFFYFFILFITALVSFSATSKRPMLSYRFLVDSDIENVSSCSRGAGDGHATNIWEFHEDGEEPRCASYSPLGAVQLKPEAYSTRSFPVRFTVTRMPGPQKEKNPFIQQTRCAQSDRQATIMNTFQ